MNEPVAQLLLACRAGDQRAWSRLVERFAGLVYAIARAHRLPDDLCDDVAQTVFATLAAHIDTIREDERLPAWISTTARRECWRCVARGRRHGSESLSSDPPAPPDDRAVEAIEQHQRLRDALASLGPRCRDLLSMLYFRAPEPAYTEISASLNIPVGSIGPTRKRCLAKLQELFADQTPDSAGGRVSAPAPVPSSRSGGPP